MTARRNGKTLIVDDEMVVRDSLNRVVGNEGYTSRARDYQALVPDSLNRREVLEGGTAGDCDLAQPEFSGAGV